MKTICRKDEGDDTKLYCCYNFYEENGQCKGNSIAMVMKLEYAEIWLKNSILIFKDM